MKILIVSQEILAPDLYLRLKNEGNEVLIAQKDKGTKDILKNSLKRVPYSERMEYAKKSDLVIFDDNTTGEAAEVRKMGVSTIGGDDKTVKLELDRKIANETAKAMGLLVPKIQEVKDLNDAKEFLKKTGGKWVLKQQGKLDNVKGLNYVAKMDNSEDLIEYINYLQEKWVKDIQQDFVLQEKVEGHEMAIGAYWNGKEFMKDKDGDECVEENFEHKSLMSGNLGESTGEQYTVMRYVKAKDSKLFKETLDKVRPLLMKIDFRGDFDINTIVTEKGAYFLEYTPRMGVPAASGQLAIHKSKWGEFFKACADGEQIEFTYDPRWTIVSWLYTKPFPFVNSKKLNALYEEQFNKSKNTEEINELLSFKLSDSKGYTILFKEKLSKEDYNNIHFDGVDFEGGKVKVANDDGFVVTVTGQGKTVDEAGKNVEKLLKKIVVPKGFYRNDFNKTNYHKAKDDLIKWGYLEDNSTEEQVYQKQQEEEKTNKMKAEIEGKYKGEYETKLGEIKKTVRSIIYES